MRFLLTNQLFPSGMVPRVSANVAVRFNEGQASRLAVVSHEGHAASSSSSLSAKQGIVQAGIPFQPGYSAQGCVFSSVEESCGKKQEIR